MDINNIMLPPKQLEASRPPGTGGHRNGASGSGVSAAAKARTPEGALLSISSRITHIKTTLDAMDIVFPPFFPIARPTRIDLIEKIKGVQEDMEKSKIPAEVKKELQGTKLGKDATDKDIGAALDGLFKVNDTFLKKSVAASGKNQRGIAVDVKV